MTTPVLSLTQMLAEYEVEQDWLFDKLLIKLNSQRHILLSAKQGWGVQEFVRELGFQLTEKFKDIRICYIDVRPAHSQTAFLELFMDGLSNAFPEVISRAEIDSKNVDVLKLPALIARRKKIRLVVFLGNCHLFHRFKDPVYFLRTLRLKFRNQPNCVFCLYGTDNTHFRNMVISPGPLCALGQLYMLTHNPSAYRSASIRKLFHSHDKKIAFTTSVQMSYLVENQPFYVKLLAWHALIKTHHICTPAVVEQALFDMIHHFDSHFQKVVECLTQKQLNLLKALVEGKQKLYSLDTRTDYQLGSSGNVFRLKESLLKKGIIDIKDKVYVFVDPVFKEWIQRIYFGS
jgi:hypothetical protein